MLPPPLQPPSICPPVHPSTQPSASPLAGCPSLSPIDQSPTHPSVLLSRHGSAISPFLCSSTHCLSLQTRSTCLSIIPPQRSIHSSVHRPLYPSIHGRTDPCTCLSIPVCVCLSSNPSVHPRELSPVCPSIRPCIGTSIHWSICLSIHLHPPTHPPVCLSIPLQTHPCPLCHLTALPTHPRPMEGPQAS